MASRVLNYQTYQLDNSHMSRHNATIHEGVSRLVQINFKIERLLAKVDSGVDTVDFRKHLRNEIDSANNQTKTLIGMIKAHLDETQERVRLLAQFDEAYQSTRKLTTRIEKIELEATHRSRQEKSNQGKRQPVPQPVASAVTNNNNNFQSDTQDETEVITFLQFNDAEIADRFQAIQEIETDARHILNMYEDFQSLMISQQGSLDTLEHNVADAKRYAEEAHQQLLKADEAGAKGRKRKCCLCATALFVILVVVLMIWIVTRPEN